MEEKINNRKSLKTLRKQLRNNLTPAEADEIRTKYLDSLNIKIIRFENKEVFEQLEGVLEEIRRNFTTPNPS